MSEYIDIEYKNSCSYITVMNLNKEQLEYRKGFTAGAIKYHTENNNIGQVKFFTDEMELINKRLKVVK